MKKAAFIDVDGTVTFGEASWEKIHNYFGLQDEMQDHSSRYFSGEITYQEWAELDLALWKDRKIEDIHKALNPPNLIEEVKEGIDKLKDAGYLTFLISGGISIMVDEVKRLIDADFAYSNIIGEHDGLVNGTIEMVVGEKSKLIKRLSKEYEIDLENSIAIGNDYNDINMFEIVGKGYAINPAHQGLIEKSELVFYSDNFKDVISDILDYQ